MHAGAHCKGFAEPFLSELQGLSGIGRAKSPVFRWAIYAHLCRGVTTHPEG
jgi:hypothetical protein